MTHALITAEEWFDGGTRRGYDPATTTLTDGASLQVFQRVHPGTDDKGDSDKPRHYPYGVTERADHVEALARSRH